MKTINVSDSTKERFKKLKIRESYMNEGDFTEEGFLNILLDLYDGINNKRKLKNEKQTN